MAIGGEAMLTESVHAYISIRRVGGFTLHADERLLLDFARCAAEKGEDHVRTTTAIEWAAGAKSLRQRGIRLRTLIRFARQVRAEDSEHQLPPDHVFAAPIYRRLPHIYEPEELCHILEEAGKLGPAGSLQPWTYQTLFGLLASCGLRISEAIALKVEDMTEDGLIIRNTKFRKTRLVPMHETTEAAMKEYLMLRQTAGGGTDHFFVSPLGKPLCYPTVSRNFLKILRGLGLRGEKGQPGPRLHDFRHTTTVRALESCPPDLVANHMLALSTYLGHSKLANTYWYIHATPQLLAGIADACQAQFEGGRS